MSKPDDISQAAWDAATDAVLNIASDRHRVLFIVAAAIMAAEKRGEERERKACAEVVRRMIPNMPPDGPISKEHEVEYETLGFAMVAILKRGQADA